MADVNDGTSPSLGKPQSQARMWFEPLLVATIMLASLYFNRDRSFSITPSSCASHDDSSECLINTNDEYYDIRSSCSSRFSSPERLKNSIDVQCQPSPSPCGYPTPAHMNMPSRILQKFPFLVEMLYWALNYVAYSMTKKTVIAVYSRHERSEVVELAQRHGIDILTFEHKTIFSIFFPVTEVAFQHFFLTKHLSIMTLFNQIYSLVHIPGTVAFLSWFYYAAPSHEAFAVARRTMSLGNFAAFIVFSFWPCMPPRLLPDSFGFHDTVRQDHAESVWVGGGNVNELAAMPSLHFTYASIVGCTFLYQTGLWQTCRGKRVKKSPWASFVYILAGVLYPLLVLSVIVATANHYYLDAVVASFSVAICFLRNRIWLLLLPIERILCRVLRLRKPTPTTGKVRKDTFDVPQQHLVIV